MLRRKSVFYFRSRITQNVTYRYKDLWQNVIGHLKQAGVNEVLLTALSL